MSSVKDVAHGSRRNAYTALIHACNDCLFYVVV